MLCRNGKDLLSYWSMPDFFAITTALLTGTRLQNNERGGDDRGDS